MAYNYNGNKNELTEEELNFALGGANLSYEEAKQYAVKRGLANAKYDDTRILDNGELTEEELSNYLGGIPFENTSSRARR